MNIKKSKLEDYDIKALRNYYYPQYSYFKPNPLMKMSTLFKSRDKYNSLDIFKPLIPLALDSVTMKYFDDLYLKNEKDKLNREGLEKLMDPLHKKLHSEYIQIMYQTTQEPQEEVEKIEKTLKQAEEEYSELESAEKTYNQLLNEVLPHIGIDIKLYEKFSPVEKVEATKSDIVEPSKYAKEELDLLKKKQKDLVELEKSSPQRRISLGGVSKKLKDIEGMTFEDVMVSGLSGKTTPVKLKSTGLSPKPKRDVVPTGSIGIGADKKNLRAKPAKLK